MNKIITFFLFNMPLFLNAYERNAFPAPPEYKPEPLPLMSIEPEKHAPLLDDQFQCQPVPSEPLPLAISVPMVQLTKKQKEQQRNAIKRTYNPLLDTSTYSQLKPEQLEREAQAITIWCSTGAYAAASEHAQELLLYWESSLSQRALGTLKWVIDKYARRTVTCEASKKRKKSKNLP